MTGEVFQLWDRASQREHTRGWGYQIAPQVLLSSSLLRDTCSVDHPDMWEGH